MLSPIRKAGLHAFLFGLTIAASGGWAAMSFQLWRFKPFGWILAIPVAIAMIGLGQAATGIPFRQLSSQWDALAGWQRGVLGVAILLAFSALLFGAIAAAVVSGMV
jgi:hypothetical protein